jgi:BNR repeat-like domain
MTTMETTEAISPTAVRAEVSESVLISQAPPELKVWGPYRMPKVYRMPGGELFLTFAVGLDAFSDQGKTGPAYASKDEGRTWHESRFPHPCLKGMNPLVILALDGEYYCIPAGQGLELDPAAMPKPLRSWRDGYGNQFSYSAMDACPPNLIEWIKVMRAVRWSPKTNAWTEESVDWDHRDQVIFQSIDPTPQGLWAQKAYMEVPFVRKGRELLHTDYWTVYLTPEGKAPAAWECHLIVSGDNGRSWQRRSTLVPGKPGDSTAEPALAVNHVGELVAVMRRDYNLAKPMYLVHSTDNGYTWTKPRELFEFGVFPQLLQLGNGVLVLTFGRPGVWMSFSRDGGHTWEKPTAIIEGDRKAPQTHSCGYTSITPLSDDSFLLAYSDFIHPNARNEPCKTIFARKITVS